MSLSENAFFHHGADFRNGLKVDLRLRAIPSIWHIYLNEWFGVVWQLFRSFWSFSLNHTRVAIGVKMWFH